MVNNITPRLLLLIQVGPLNFESVYNNGLRRSFTTEIAEPTEFFEGFLSDLRGLSGESFLESPRSWTFPKFPATGR